MNYESMEMLIKFELDSFRKFEIFYTPDIVENINRSSIIDLY